MRTPVIAGNWKMNLDQARIRELAGALREALDGDRSVEVGVAPPHPYLALVAGLLDGSTLWVAGQDGHWEGSGAYTGDVSCAMLADVGCTHVILGHSERRHGWGETPEQVGGKVRAALKGGLVPIVCVGETLEQRQADFTRQVVVGQLDAALEGLGEKDLAGLIVAYEPVWAIGTGLNATADQAGEVHCLLRERLGESLSSSFAESVRIQYGGSVKPENAAELLAVDDVDGALVGGAALAPHSFVGIVRAARSGTEQVEQS